ncbi:MAG: hypothetical protein PVF57_03820 [Pseudomonadales bacterium]
MLFISRLSRRLEDALLSVAAGIMLAAAFLSLLVPYLAQGEALYGSGAAASLTTAGVLLGALTLYLRWPLRTWFPSCRSRSRSRAALCCS